MPSASLRCVSLGPRFCDANGGSGSGSGWGGSSLHLDSACPGFSQSDVAVALHWACPGVLWPPGLGSASQTHAHAHSHSHRGSGSSFGSGTGAGADGGVTVAALAFACPYASSTLRGVEAAGRELVRRRAFAHHFDEFGVQGSELLCAADGVRDALA